ncbi:DNA mismatch repair protein MutS [Paenibacillaceae bacterium]|nr:DNA mismatch repair protein MutS [Paenibacillaceae bacterium]
MSTYTPMILQYLEIKKEAADAFLFFRLGDFYEMFFDDAILAAKELEITLTGRGGGTEERIPMCGVPYHSAEGYIARLIEKGYKVAICEQVEEPSAAKGVVRREIVRVVTPGTVMESKSLEGGANNFISAVADSGADYGLAVCDLSTGELYVTSLTANAEMLNDEINVYRPAEIVGDQAPLRILQDGYAAWGSQVLITERGPLEEDKLEAQFGAAALAVLSPIRKRAVSLLTGYLTDTQKRSLGHIRQIRSYEAKQYMVLDQFTRRNLELTETVQERSKKGSLLWLLDKTQTSMGARLLRRWIDKPLLSQSAIEERLEAVEKLYHDLILRDDLRAELKGIYDLERLVGRVAFGSANGRDLNALRSSLRHVPPLKAYCTNSPSGTLNRLVDELDDCADLADLIETVLIEDPPLTIREGGLIRSGYDDYLDRLREASANGKKWLAELEQSEREATGIRSLKIGYNKVFGYYLEVTKANIAQLPQDRYERKQTLANAERYVTPELKEKERLILEAEDKMVDLEYQRFLELREHLSAHLPRLQKLAEVLAAIDVYQSLAAVSAEQRFSRPVIAESGDLLIEDGRHPVVEAVMGDASFIANDTHLTVQEGPVLLITGPNMAGKSTYMRQVALICVLAQIGCFVPAKSAVIPVIDRIFTRIGAADDLIGGQSTFMVEMKDIQIMTEKATPRSLVIIDELGRGTSTGEGMAIAQAVIEFVHDTIKCKALVSTHFHELAHLEETLAGLRNARMAVQESGDKVTFLRKLVSGAASTSYGIYCARLAGLPSTIIARAYDLLQEAGTTDGLQEAIPILPTRSGSGSGGSGVAGSDYSSPQAQQDLTLRETAAASSASGAVRDNSVDADGGETGAAVTAADASEEIVQLSIFGSLVQPEPVKSKKTARAEQLADQLKKLDLFNMTPLQAMQWLNDMKQKMTD